MTGKSKTAEIARIILDYADAQKRRHGNAPFHMADLAERIAEKRTVAPDTTGRQLRRLKGQGKINYIVVDRQQSLYQFV